MAGSDGDQGTERIGDDLAALAVARLGQPSAPAHLTHKQPSYAFVFERGLRHVHVDRDQP
jgi:hypothetical protein